MAGIETSLSCHLHLTWAAKESNLPPLLYQSSVLTDELAAHNKSGGQARVAFTAKSHNTLEMWSKYALITNKFYLFLPKNKNLYLLF